MAGTVRRPVRLFGWEAAGRSGPFAPCDQHGASPTTPRCPGLVPGPVATWLRRGPGARPGRRPDEPFRAWGITRVGSGHSVVRDGARRLGAWTICPSTDRLAAARPKAAAQARPRDDLHANGAACPLSACGSRLQPTPPAAVHRTAAHRGRGLRRGSLNRPIERQQSTHTGQLHNHPAAVTTPATPPRHRSRRTGRPPRSPRRASCDSRR